MIKTGILVIGSRLASLYDDCLKMRIYTNKEDKFKEIKLVIRNIDEAIELCTKMGIKRIYVSEASGKDIKHSHKCGIELLEEENLWHDKLYKRFVMSAYC